MAASFCFSGSSNKSEELESHEKLTACQHHMGKEKQLRYGRCTFFHWFSPRLVLLNRPVDQQQHSQQHTHSSELHGLTL